MTLSALDLMLYSSDLRATSVIVRLVARLPGSSPYFIARLPVAIAIGARLSGLFNSRSLG